MITVFYDGKCNLCSKEIKYYKSIADENVFNWFDIANDPMAGTFHGASSAHSPQVQKLKKHNP